MKYLKIFKNWRIIALTVAFVFALILILADSDSIKDIIVNLLGVALAFYTYKVGTKWHKDGLIDEINIFNEK